MRGSLDAPDDARMDDVALLAQSMNSVHEILRLQEIGGSVVRLPRQNGAAAYLPLENRVTPHALHPLIEVLSLERVLGVTDRCLVHNELGSPVVGRTRAREHGFGGEGCWVGSCRAHGASGVFVEGFGER